MSPGPRFLKRAEMSRQHALRFWLERGAAGFAICDTDAAYSEEVKCLSFVFQHSAKGPQEMCNLQTLSEWRRVLKTFGEEEERYSSLSEAL